MDVLRECSMQEDRELAIELLGHLKVLP
jgi:hypothetical protein